MLIYKQLKEAKLEGLRSDRRVKIVASINDYVIEVEGKVNFLTENILGLNNGARIFLKDVQKVSYCEIN